MKILIVEDDPNILEIIQTIINPALDVHYSENFHDAKAYLESNSPDIVVTDFNFPGGDGNMVAELARKGGCERIYLHSGNAFQIEDTPEKNLYTAIFDKFKIFPTLKTL